jgi:hypothetical protein
MMMADEGMVLEIIVASMVMMMAKNTHSWSGEKDQFDTRTLVFDGVGTLICEKLTSRIMIFFTYARSHAQGLSEGGSEARLGA